MVQIYGTLGPACSDTKTLEALFQAGMTGVRLNLSHAGLDRAAEQIEHLHAAARSQLCRVVMEMAAKVPAALWVWPLGKL